MSVQDINSLRSFIINALKEDVGDGDHTSLATIPKGSQGKAHLLIKEPGVLAGVGVAIDVTKLVDPTLEVEVRIPDGSEVQAGDVAMTIQGDIQSILLAERLMLNIMQRMSGVATTTRRIVKLLEGTNTKVLDTRKTTPLMRALEKEAVALGGGTNHRFGLYDMILIKDNHIDYAGGITQAISAANAYRQGLNKSLDIEIEVRNFDELDAVLAHGGVERIMLDNFSVADVRKAVGQVDGRFVLEASGGITETDIRAYAETGVDFISMGALTHSVKSLDISLKAFGV